ncbi:MAG: nucleoside triphosphate pyrophosphohydrolase [Candidatus Eremiobacteraeota bacterium]|nr:nucleoside triphosphate pyrophosphohydrolase [Candidatus Eremiobacteraeota bacterium]MBC5822928.1 nucleoside triphosphate pyrophosphohydrolase [Candidatus Eremiobacteraeota bacterium]
MMVRIVGLGPGDADLITLGSLEALRAAGRAVTLLAPPELVLFLESEGVEIVRDGITEPALFVRGSRDAIDAFVRALDGRDLALGVLGNPLSDFPGLPLLLRELERAGARTELVPGMSRATLAAAIAMPLIPLPPASAHYTWPDLVEVMARLRRTCPWDREQTHATLVPYLIEETYEVADAIETHADAELCEELGDLLLQIVFHAQLATERGKFSIADVIDGLSNKMIRRHPHVFGDQAVSGVAEVWRNWEQLKALEPSAQKRRSRLDGIPLGLGALQRGQKMQDKAARVGFDWPSHDGVRGKLAEELAELETARRENDTRAVREELGDVLFTLVNYARALGIDAEGAMRDANAKFDRRFRYMERRAETAGRSLGDLSLDELEELWQLAKAQAA